MTPHDRVPTCRAIPSLEAIQAKPIAHRGRKQIRLALDLSTSCVGWALGAGTEILAYGKFVFADDREMGDKLVSFADHLLVLLKTFKPHRVVAERPMSRRGQVTALHNQMLGVVRHIVFQHLSVEVLDTHLISPITVKNRLGVRKGKDHAQNKQYMVEHINEVLGLNLKYHPNSKLQTQDDVADAIAILLAWEAV